MSGYDYNGWRTALTGAVDDLLRGFEARFGYPPGEPTLGGPVGPEELAAAEGAVPVVLLEFHRHVGEVALPDAYNGFFIHSLGLMLTGLSDPYSPKRAPALTDSDLVVFGSDGGGTLFALGVEGAPVYLLPVGAIEDGVYLGEGRELFPSFTAFLDWLLTAVRGAAAGDFEKAVYPL
ncbi:SMI1/KNR4 family protein [Saccharothrix obliqua]|uniref:SMI1/KNR4 family protein n=1 Tax=Saccharothrix obliqua TaxID=2861747 RepID=UPI001C5D9654|nr:SMI1/KNR4 family protein [Saccharothrix obliqua]MBW4717290.1 SMI1/KNR4 family protein [Saccharothrix obliqua]